MVDLALDVDLGMVGDRGDRGDRRLELCEQEAALVRDKLLKLALL